MTVNYDTQHNVNNGIDVAITLQGVCEKKSEIDSQKLDESSILWLSYYRSSQCV